MLEHKTSFNLYMFHGGTSFGFAPGASLKGSYRPQTTSYDFDAPVDESGQPTRKYFAFRRLLQRYSAAPLPAMPAAPPVMAVSDIRLTGDSRTCRPIFRGATQS